MLSKLREGDTVVVWKMDRIARSLSHLAKLVEDFENRGVHFKSIQENFIDTLSTQGRFVFNLFASIAQLERDIIIERTRAGLESSRRRGVKLGRKPGLSSAARHKAMLAERYYREKELSVEEIMKLIEVGSKKHCTNIWLIKAGGTARNVELFFGIKIKVLKIHFVESTRMA